VVNFVFIVKSPTSFGNFDSKYEFKFYYYLWSVKYSNIFFHEKNFIRPNVEGRTFIARNKVTIPGGSHSRHLQTNHMLKEDKLL